jgi:3-(3-hydroxy-phenyl)propionate hydroxylase
VNSGSMQDRTVEHDVLVIGLGPVGSTAANIAGALGLSCLGVDASESVFGLPRAIHFDADVMRIFQSIGLAEEIEAISRVTQGSVHLGADGEPIRDFRVPQTKGQLGWYPHYLFYQPELDQLLRDRASSRPGVETLLGWRCTRIDQDADGVIGYLEHPSEGKRHVRAHHLIACDGASSAIRSQFGIELFDYDFEEPWLVVDLLVPSEDMGPNHMVAHCDPSRPLVYIPGPGRHRRWEFMLLPGESAAEMSDRTRSLELVEAASPWLDVADAELVRSAVYVFHGLVARTWSVGRVMFAGDATHQTPPFYGQGMCHGIRDVHNLLWKLALVAHNQAAPALLDTYQREREPHVKAVIEAAVENGRYVCVLDVDEARRRDEEYRAKVLEGTDVRSWRGIIPGLHAGLLDLGSIDSPAVGELIPQPRLRDGDGNWRLLDDLLGAQFAIVGIAEVSDSLRAQFEDELGGTVVTIRGDGEAPSEAAYVEAEPGLLASWFADHDCRWAVVRPDRYVFGVAGEPSELRSMADGLRETLAGAGY